MITEETAVNVLQEFLSAKLGRTVSKRETNATLRALEYAYKTKEEELEEMVRESRGTFRTHTKNG